MGATQSCQDLKEFDNACEMHACVTNVTGLESKSASPSDTWLLEFQPDTKYDNKPCHYGFLKWWINHVR
jgi:hypothetical protein